MLIRGQWGYVIHTCIVNIIGGMFTPPEISTYNHERFYKKNGWINQRRKQWVMWKQTCILVPVATEQALGEDKTRTESMETPNPIIRTLITLSVENKK